MATYRAVEAACAALAHLLDDAPKPERLAATGPVFRVGGARQGFGAVPTGAGILPYRLQVEPAPPPGRGSEPGPPLLSVAVRVLVVVTAADPGPGLALAGWILRTLHDHPVLLPATLAAPTGAERVFTDDETVQVTFDDMSTDELLQVREALGVTGDDALALPYVLTGLVLE